jgi:subtilisin family serine protease
MNPIDLIRLRELMALTAGAPDVVVGLIDGPVAADHPDLAGNSLMHGAAIPAGSAGTQAAGVACQHATFVAGILTARRGSAAPAICPDCTLMVRPVFRDTTQGILESPAAEPEELAVAILDCIATGARILNLSLALMQSSPNARRALVEALDKAARRGVIVVAAAGNQGSLGGTAITGHPWVIPVAACDLRGRPLADSNLGLSIGKRGFRAPGDQITSLGACGPALTLSGTSAAAPFVTGAIALLWSLFPSAGGAEIASCLVRAHSPHRRSVTPPLLDAGAVYRLLAAAHTMK